MGSFYTTCSVSHMVLTNQKTSIQLLVPNYSTDFQEHLGMIVSNYGSQCFFAPFGFPIHGRYYDYGGIEDIQRDKNVEMLEDFFNLSIDQIISNVGDDRWYRYGIVEHEKDVRTFGEYQYKVDENFTINVGSWFFWKNPKDGIESLCQRGKGGSGDGHRNSILVVKGHDLEVKWEDCVAIYESNDPNLKLKPISNTWRLIGKDGGEVKNQEIFLKLGMTYIRTEVLEHLQNGWENVNDRYIKDILEKLDVEEGQAPRNERMKKVVDDLMIKKQTVGLSDEEHDQIIELLADLREMSWDAVRTYIPSLVKTNMFKLLPITTSVFKDEMCKQYRFLMTYGHDLRRTLLPSDYGSQDTNYSALLELNSLVSSLLEKDLLNDCVDELKYYFDEKTGKVDLKEYREDYGSRVPTSIIKKATKILKENLAK